jgi:L-rhamnose mutarotase
MIVVEKIAFVMTLKPGCEEEYKKRHDQLWPELALELKKAGISNYSIYLHPPTLKLFAILDRTHDHTMADLPNTPAVKKWWSYMADLMETNLDSSPLVEDLKPMFYFK